MINNTTGELVYCLLQHTLILSTIS